MAEFQEVIKHWGRMLHSHKHGESIAIEASVPADAFKDAKLVEEIVMSWAAEHPEPVYPTWAQWLQEMGLIKIRWNGPVLASMRSGVDDTDYIPVVRKMLEHIPADTAEKLGIEPKEDNK